MQKTDEEEELFPAWAGVIHFYAYKIFVSHAFPRMGGGDPVSVINGLPGVYFSPHGRG